MAKKAILKTTKRQYQKLYDLGTTVVAMINTNPFFATPAPSLADVTTATDELLIAMNDWNVSNPHNRGSHSQLLVLRDKATAAHYLLSSMADYVTGVANDPTNATPGPEVIIASSGFAATADRTPAATPEEVQNFRSIVRKNIPNDQIRLRWKKPAGSTQKPTGYVVTGSATGDFANPSQVAITGKTFLQFEPGTNKYFKVQAFNTVGYGIISTALFAVPPLPTA